MIALTILTLLMTASALTFYSGYIACRNTLRKRTEECTKLKDELDFMFFQNETLRKEIREEKNKNLIMESLLNQYKK